MALGESFLLNVKLLHREKARHSIFSVSTQQTDVTSETIQPFCFWQTVNLETANVKE